MRLKRLCVLLAFLAGVTAPLDAKKRLLGPDNGIAIDQKSGITRVGWFAALDWTGRGIVAGPNFAHWNFVTVDTGPYRYQWQELKENGRLIFVLNEQFRFWQYGNKFLVVDIEGKTHKFGMVSAVKK